MNLHTAGETSCSIQILNVHLNLVAAINYLRYAIGCLLKFL